VPLNGELGPVPLVELWSQVDASATYWEEQVHEAELAKIVALLKTVFTFLKHSSHVFHPRKSLKKLGEFHLHEAILDSDISSPRGSNRLVHRLRIPIINHLIIATVDRTHFTLQSRRI